MMGHFGFFYSSIKSLSFLRLFPYVHRPGEGVRDSILSWMTTPWWVVWLHFSFLLRHSQSSRCTQQQAPFIGCT
jgi:hypothetical protein